jgi:hypothetical protein
MPRTPTSVLAAKKAERHIQRLKRTFEKSADYRQHEANDFEVAEFINTNALITPDRFYGDKSPEKLNTVYLSPARVRFYQDPKRPNMVHEIKGEVTGLTYKILTFNIAGGGSYVINYKRFR